VANNYFKKKNDKKPMNYNNQNKKSNHEKGNSNGSHSRHDFTYSYNISRPIEWIVDNSASQHVISHKEVFILCNLI